MTLAEPDDPGSPAWHYSTFPLSTSVISAPSVFELPQVTAGAISPGPDYGRFRLFSGPVSTPVPEGARVGPFTVHWAMPAMQPPSWLTALHGPSEGVSAVTYGLGPLWGQLGNVLLGGVPLKDVRVVLPADADDDTFSTLFTNIVAKLSDVQATTTASDLLATATASDVPMTVGVGPAEATPIDVTALYWFLAKMRQLWFEAGRYGEAGLAIRRLVLVMLTLVVVTFGIADGLVHLDDHQVNALAAAGTLVAAGVGAYAMMPKGKDKE